MRRFLIAIVALCFATPAAFAGDYADLNILGFSADGAYFAFEEYGYHDGSGFPYSSIFVIETDTDSWVEGTPIRERIEDEAATLESVRASAYERAAPILAEYGIALPGRILVSNPITELPPTTEAEFLLYALNPPQTTGGWRLSIAVLPFPSDCPPDFYDAYVGFALTLTSPDGVLTELHRDKRIPESRACPVDYTISEVLAFNRDDAIVLVTLLNVFSLGFEGPDRRFLAVTTIIDD